jgi:hypothetical protein
MSDVMETGQITDGESTRAVKSALRQVFPGVKLRVSEGGSRIGWTDDGPDIKAVEDALLAAGCAVVWQTVDDKRVLEVSGIPDQSYLVRSLQRRRTRGRAGRSGAPSAGI